MPPRTLASLAHALTVSASPDAALHALGEALAEVDRFAHLALIRFDAPADMLRERHARRAKHELDVMPLETTFDHLPPRERTAIEAGGQFVDFGEAERRVRAAVSASAARRAGVAERARPPLRRTSSAHSSSCTRRANCSARERPSVSCRRSRCSSWRIVRFLEREARDDAVARSKTSRKRVHGEYERRLADLEARLLDANNNQAAGDSARVVTLERELAQATEDARRAMKRANAVDATIGAAVEQLEKAHVELHRRSESLRQKTRYDLSASTACSRSTRRRTIPRKLADGLLAARRRRHARASLLAHAAHAGRRRRCISPRRAASRQA